MKLLILDKDGTLVKPRSGNRFVQHPKDQVLYPNVLDLVRKHVDAGGRAIIVSNQAGISAGHKSYEATVEEMQYCLELLNGLIVASLFCPDYEGDTVHVVRLASNPPTSSSFSVTEVLGVEDGKRLFGSGYFRKPNPGMLKFAMTKHSELLKIAPFQPSDCLMVGDHPEDAEAAEAAGIDFLDALEWRKGT